ncbi:MAG: helix-turn-helix domain-containing protein [Thermoleophilia bacterium]|nr:helix-turn-helix domain-containing protein [Thermoleophilia bacterium]
MDRLECLTAEEVAERLRISKSHVYDLARRGQLPHVKLGSDVRFPRATLERWLVDGDRPEPVLELGRRSARRRRARG